MILLHGLASNCHIWDLVAPMLAPYFKVYALDQRGHGETESPNTGYGFDTITRDLQSFLGTLGVDRPLLVGHSWGGNVALNYAASHPSSLSGLTLVDGGTIEISRIPGMTSDRAQIDLAPPDFTGMTRDILLQRARERDVVNLWSPEVEIAFLANFHISPSGAVRPRFDRSNHLQVVQALWEHKPSNMYSMVRCPVLIVPAWRQPRTERDSMLAESRRQAIHLAQEMLQEVQVLWMDNTVHDIPLHRPRELATAILDFAAGLW
jgi:pimeloyl-ACP methyl ester carboxylesterase